MTVKQHGWVASENLGSLAAATGYGIMHDEPLESSPAAFSMANRSVDPHESCKKSD